MKKQYTYWVSYHHSHGSGSSAITRPTKIKTIDDIMAIAKCIEESSNVSNVGIISFYRLKGERYE